MRTCVVLANAFERSCGARRTSASVIMTTYNPISENLIATEPGNGGEAKGNCVVVRRGGKQPKAKEQSQMQVNSIRYLSAASLLANGEACAERNLWAWHPPANTEHRAGMYGVTVQANCGKSAPILSTKLSACS